MVATVADAAATVAPAGMRSNFLLTENHYLYNRFRFCGAGCLSLIIVRMKKFFILAALSAITLAACASGSIEDKKAKLEADLQAVVAEFNECKTALLKDSTLTTEQLEAKYEEAYNKAIKTYNDICIKTIKKNRNNELGLEAFKQVYYQLEPKEALEVIGLLGADIQNDDFVVKAKSTLEAASRAAEGQPFVDFEVDGVKFSDFVGKGKYILVDFWASWCGPCRMLSPVVDELAEQYAGKVKFGKVNVDEQPRLAMTYAVQSIPTLLLFK